MSSRDFIQKFILTNLPVRGAIVHLELSLQAILEQHQYPDMISEVVAESLVASVLVTSSIKWRGRFIMQFQSNGPLSLLVSKVTHNNEISAMAKWKDPLPELADELLGDGKVVTSLLQDGRSDPYQSIINLDKSGLTESLQNYFLDSEQLPTKLWITGNQESAHGLLLQEMPADNNQIADKFNFNEFIKSLDENKLDFDLHEYALLKGILPEHDCQVFNAEQIVFSCGCSADKMRSALITLGEQEVRAELAGKPYIEVCCEFCNSKYSFDDEDITDIFSQS